MTDYITAEQRLNPPSLFRRWCGNFALEVWWKYNLRIARWEYDKAKEARAFSIATEWMQHVEKLEEMLKRIGVDPREVEDVTKLFEVYLTVGILLALILFGVMVNLYRSALVELIR